MRRALPIQIALVLLLASPASALVIVTFDGPDAPVALGAEFTVDVLADADELLLGFGFAMDFNDWVVDIVDVSVPAPWFEVYSPQGDVAALGPPAGVSGTGILLATFTFEALALGTSEFFLDVLPDDPTEGFSLKSGGFDTWSDTPLEVTVPEPDFAALWLLGFLGIALSSARPRRPRAELLGWAVSAMALVGFAGSVEAQPACAGAEAELWQQPGGTSVVKDLGPDGRVLVWETLFNFRGGHVFEVGNPSQISIAFQGPSPSPNHLTLQGYAGTTEEYDATSGEFVETNAFWGPNGQLRSGPAVDVDMKEVSWDESAVLGSKAGSPTPLCGNPSMDWSVWTEGGGSTLLSGGTPLPIPSPFEGQDVAGLLQDAALFGVAVPYDMSADGRVVAGFVGSVREELYESDGQRCSGGSRNGLRCDGGCPSGFCYSPPPDSTFCVGKYGPNGRAAVWIDGALQVIDDTPLCTGPVRQGIAGSVSDDGTTVSVGGTCEDGEARSFLWNVEEGARPIPISIFHFPGVAIDPTTARLGLGLLPSGDVAMGTLRAWEGNGTQHDGDVLWTPADGLRPIEEALSDLGLAPMAYSPMGGWSDVSGDMLYGVNATGDPIVISLPCQDDDQDGLCNGWERAKGIDLNGDGAITLCVDSLNCPDLQLEDANPDVMDIYVEVDRLANTTFNPSSLQAVKDAFATVPAALMANGQEAGGIKIHLELDETDLTLLSGTQTWQPHASGSDCSLHQMPDMAQFRAQRFGTPNQRWHQDVIDAKRKIYRHLIFGGIQSPKTHSGRADPFGNEAIVTLDAFPVAAISPDWQAATVMHELGHTFGLRHGGGDHNQYKPNYVSVMNYTWQLRANVNVDSVPSMKLFDAAWQLDYSRRQLDTLDEGGLSEPAGINGSIHDFTPRGPLRACPNPSFLCARLERMWRWIDWNESRTWELDPSNVGLIDINYVIDPALNSESGVGVTHFGFNDWAHVTANLCETYAHPNWDDSSSSNSCQGWNGTTANVVNVTSEEALSFLEQDMFLDCNMNGVRDEEDLAQGVDVDLNDDGLLDGCEPLWGDLDEDEDIDEDDRQLLMASFGRTEGEPEYNVLADLDDDRYVTHLDYQQWVERLEAWEAGQAAAAPYQTSCGLGWELALLLPPAIWLRGRRRRLH